jgi:chorismate synthase
MSYNSFGRSFRVTTFGESHGPAVGVVIDGVPSRFEVDLDAIQRQLDRRRPGQGPLTSPRQESDRLQVLAGLLDGRTTGAPICLVVANRDARPEDYEHLREVLRPGHADLSWQAKYGLRDWRGGGRASGRETVARVAAGAVARQLLAARGVQLLGHVVELAGIQLEAGVELDPAAIERSPVRCADPRASGAMVAAVAAARADGDSVGGVVEVRARGVPAGWGDPVFDKLDARLASALMGLGAVKGVEIGEGFALARRRGSEANDPILPGGAFATNRAGGVLGGVSSGAELVVRAAVKPTPSIAREQATVDLAGRPSTVRATGRHDPCIAPRLVPVAEAMVALVLVDAWLRHDPPPPGVDLSDPPRWV